MADANSSDGFNKSRSILGEITNLQAKKGFSEIDNRGKKRPKLNEKVKQIGATPSQYNDINPLKENSLKLPDEIEDAKVLGFVNDGHFLIGENACDGNKIMDYGRRTALLHSVNDLVVENGFMDCCGEKICSRDCKSTNSTDRERGRAANSVATKDDECKKLDLMKANNISTDAQVFPEMGNHCGEVASGSLKISKGKTDLSFEGALAFVNAEASDETGGDALCGGNAFDAYELKVINDYQNDGDDHNADNFLLSQSGSIDCMILPESQESRAFGVERSAEPKKGDECAYISEEIDSIKACSCSFCTKAAYMWLDLNYQDIKARVSAMKKSQKEASMLAGRSIRHNVIEKHIGESFPSVSHLEYHLMHQWRSLFQHIGDLLNEESSHLEARLLPLSDLREKYKAELEMSNGASTDMH